MQDQTRNKRGRRRGVTEKTLLPNRKTWKRLTRQTAKPGTPMYRALIAEGDTGPLTREGAVRILITGEKCQGVERKTIDNLIDEITSRNGAVIIAPATTDTGCYVHEHCHSKGIPTFTLLPGHPARQGTRKKEATATALVKERGAVLSFLQDGDRDGRRYPELLASLADITVTVKPYGKNEPLEPDYKGMVTVHDIACALATLKGKPHFHLFREGNDKEKEENETKIKQIKELIPNKSHEKQCAPTAE